MAGPIAPRRRSWKSRIFWGIVILLLVGAGGYLLVAGFNATFRSEAEHSRLLAQGEAAVLACLDDLEACQDEEVIRLVQDMAREKFEEGEAAGRAQAAEQATTAYHQGRADGRAEVLARAAAVIAGEVPAESLEGDEAVLRYAIEAWRARQQLEMLQEATPTPPPRP